MASLLLTGGARSGKSRFATELAAARGERVLFVATATAGDDEMRRRIAKHQQERPTAWRTLETPLEVGSRTAAALGDAAVVIIDCLTLLVNNILGDCTGGDGGIDEAAAEESLEREVAALQSCIGGSEATFIIVTNEVGLGIVPANALSRIYRDLLGKANQQIAAIVDEVYLLVAGQPLRIKPN
jgi:adenosylcobinamide kinase/adenosylcobinamide-phosphate guanylyltransferase